MRIWQLDNTLEEYETIQAKEFKYYDDNYFDPGFKGKSMINNWATIEMATIHRGKKSDVPWCGHMVPVFSKKSIEVLKDLIKGSVELLPLNHDDYKEQNQLYAINIVNLRDCIDYEKSERKVFRSGKMGPFTKYVFKEDIVRGVHIFKIKDLPYIREFYSDEFRERALRSNLRGFRFNEVWNSEKNSF